LFRSQHPFGLVIVVAWYLASNTASGQPQMLPEFTVQSGETDARALLSGVQRMFIAVADEANDANDFVRNSRQCFTLMDRIGNGPDEYSIQIHDRSDACNSVSLGRNRQLLYRGLLRFALTRGVIRLVTPGMAFPGTAVRIPIDRSPSVNSSSFEQNRRPLDCLDHAHNATDWLRCASPGVDGSRRRSIGPLNNHRTRDRSYFR
jgi:hypothetical protein